jgi:hypothetical protein
LLLINRPIILPEGTWEAPPNSSFATALLLQDVAYLYHPDSCTDLQQVQQDVCDMVQHDSNIQWPSFESEPGWLFIWSVNQVLSP